MHKILAAFGVSIAVASTSLAAQPPAEAWQIGPIIKGRNYSVGMPATLQAGPQGPWFTFPRPGEGHVHYITLGTGSLQNARTITVRYRIDAKPRTRFIAQERQSEGKFGLVFQRARDNWSAKGRYEAYRWYSPTAVAITPGDHTLVVRLDDPRWGAVMTSTAASNPQGFANALADAESISLTFGGDGGRGHGVYATGAARFTLLTFGLD